MDEKIIKKLNNMTSNKHNKEVLYNISKKEISEIKTKFKELKNYKYKQPNEIDIGMMIRYVDRNLTKLSIIGVVKHIEYFSLINKNRIRSIHLYGVYSENATLWKVNPKSIYIFQVKRPQKSKLLKTLENTFDIEFFENELAKHNSSS